MKALLCKALSLIISFVSVIAWHTGQATFPDPTKRIDLSKFTMTFEDEFDDTSSSTSSTSSASSDKNYGIKIINTLDEDIYVRLVYSCSNELDDPIVSNIDTKQTQQPKKD